MTSLTRLRGPMVAPASGRDPQSMVVLLHGYGSNGDDLMGLVPYWRASLPDTVFLSPNAPEACPGAPGGYQWWSLTDLGRESRAAGVRQAAPLVNAFIDMHRAAYDLPNSKVALVGFSQGTIVTTLLTAAWLKRGEAPTWRGNVLVCGIPPRCNTWRARLPKPLA